VGSERGRGCRLFRQPSDDGHNDDHDGDDDTGTWGSTVHVLSVLSVAARARALECDQYDPRDNVVLLVASVCNDEHVVVRGKRRAAQRAGKWQPLTKDAPRLSFLLIR
jgi:hypothetical protein